MEKELHKENLKGREREGGNDFLMVAQLVACLGVCSQCSVGGKGRRRAERHTLSAAAGRQNNITSGFHPGRRIKGESQ